MMAAADIGGGGNKKDPFRKWPKGLVGSLGIAYLLSGIFLMFAYFYCDNLGLKEPVYLLGLVVFCLILGFLGIKYDYKRLLKKIGAGSNASFDTQPNSRKDRQRDGFPYRTI